MAAQIISIAGRLRPRMRRAKLRPYSGYRPRPGVIGRSRSQ